jgi:hypothetical protein
MTSTTTLTTAAPQPATLWRCGGRQCGAGECEHEDGELHRHAAGGGPAYAPPIVHDVLRASGTPLPAGVLQEMEGRLSHSFADVRIHTDDRAAESAAAVEADAYTVGRHIAFAAGRFEPTSADGERLLVHELTHVMGTPPRAPVPRGSLRVSSPTEPSEVGARAAASSPTSVRARATRPSSPAETVQRQHGPSRTTSAAVQTPATCLPGRALTWADFKGTPSAHSPFAGLTRFSFSSLTSGSRDWIVATFDRTSSWVKSTAAAGGHRARNGCARNVSSCQRFFGALPPGNTGWQNLGATTGCAASVQPDTTLRATNRAECETVLGAECDRVAGLESARLLHHEQLHLDLACAIAAKGNSALAAAHPTRTTTILAAVRHKSNTQTNRYDHATRHGCNAASQARWDTDVAAGLPAVTIP